MVHHYVAFKFKEGSSISELYSFLKKEYQELSMIVSGVGTIKVHRNSVPREYNMDVLIEITFEDTTALNHYLSHKSHKSIKERLDPYVINRFSFDYEI